MARQFRALPRAQSVQSTQAEEIPRWDSSEYERRQGALHATGWDYYPKQVIMRALIRILDGMTTEVDRRPYEWQRPHPDFGLFAQALSAISKRGQSRPEALAAARSFIEGSMNDVLFEHCYEIAGENDRASTSIRIDQYYETIPSTIRAPIIAPQQGGVRLARRGGRR
jgi:hypothetical protein